MSTGFFSFDDKNKLIDVSQMAFESEDALQKLVAEYPQLLSGDEGSAAGISEWLFVAREMGIPSGAPEIAGRLTTCFLTGKEFRR